MLVNVVETSGGTRGYRSVVRQERAAETRLRVIGAAAELFGRQGYVATTFAQLASEAGVSVETVRKHGPKSALLRAAIELGSFGVEGEADVLETDVGRALLAIDDPGALAEFLGEVLLAINAPSAGLWSAVLGTAPNDPEVADFRDEMLTSIRGQVTSVLGVLRERGWLRDDVPFDELVEAFCVVTSVESYVRFVLVDRRPVHAYRAFVSRTIRETILAR
jgi:AcrR family transcriptional regulator